MTITRLNASIFAALNPVLHNEELGVERDTGLLKIGDGITGWNSLPYLPLTASQIPDISATYKKLYAPEAFGAVGDGTTDDSAALASWIASGKDLTLTPGKIYCLSNRLIIGNSVKIAGYGGMFPTRGSVIKLTAASAGIWIQGAGHNITGLSVNGNNVANIGVQVGGTVAGQAGADGFYGNIYVSNCVQQNFLVQGQQNSIFSNIRIQGGSGDGFVVDFSCGGCLFQRIECAGAAGYNLRVTQSATATGGYAQPSDLTFVKCIAEQSSTDQPQVFLEKSYDVRFLDLAVYSGGTSPTQPLIYVTSYGWTVFHNLNGLATGSNQALMKLRNVSDGPARVGLTGITRAAGTWTGLFDIDATSKVVSNSHIPDIVDAGTALYVSGSAKNYVQYREGADVHWSASASDISRESIKIGDTQPLVYDLLDGTRRWGPGGSSLYDTQMQRTGVGTLSVTNRIVEGATSTTLAADGAVTLDASAGSTHFIFMNGHNLTGLSITNGVSGQKVSVVIQQGATPTTLTLPLAANNFLWAGGDAGVPKARQAYDIVAFSLTLMLNTYWVEVGSPRRRVNRTVFTSNGSYTPSDGVTAIDVLVVGGGGGGGGGYRGAAGVIRCGGGGGGGGGVSRATFDIGDITAPVTVTVGLGGTGGNAASSDSSAGTNGGAGGVSSFGSYLTTLAAGGGAAGGSGTAGTAGGSGFGTLSTNGPGGQGPASGAAGAAGANNFGPGGGGGGGGITAANVGAAGGTGGYYIGVAQSNATGGANTGATGGNGTSNTKLPGNAGGGGGANASGAGGNGGNGGNYGAGGGGGGASLNGSTSGAGGNGAPGIVVVTEYY